MEVNLSVFDSFPILKTRRLTLREIREEDASEIFAMRANGRVGAFIPRPLMQEEAAALKLVERTRAGFENRQAIGWAGILRDSGTIIGTCGFNQFDLPNLRAEIGGEMATEYWGKGIAQEAVGAILHFGLHKLGLHSIEAKVSPDNRGAIKILETYGFRKEAHHVDRILFRGKFLDMAIYTLIKGNEMGLMGH